MVSNLSKSSLAFIKAVANPIAADEPAQVPDNETMDSLCLTDYVDTNRPVNNTGANQYGLLLWLRVHDSPFYDTYVGSTTALYSVCYAFTDTNGLMVPNSVTSKFEEFLPSNLISIAGGTTITPNSALVTGLRMFAMGLRVLPTIEYVTDTSVTYVVRFIGGYVSMQELSSAYANSTNVETIIRNSAHAETFPNNIGCSVRYNPFQNDIQLRTQNLEDAMNTAQSFTFHHMPAVYCRFSAAIAAASSAPVIVHSRFWIEGVLRKPSPIYAEPSPTDINYPMIKAALSGCHPEFPCVVGGHSFPAIGSIFLRTAKVLFQISKTIVGLGTAYNQTGNMLVRGKKGKLPKKKKNRRKAQPYYRPALAIGQQAEQLVGKPRNVQDLSQRQRKRGKRNKYQEEF